MFKLFIIEIFVISKSVPEREFIPVFSVGEIQYAASLFCQMEGIKMPKASTTFKSCSELRVE